MCEPVAVPRPKGTRTAAYEPARRPDDRGPAEMALREHRLPLLQCSTRALQREFFPFFRAKGPALTASEMPFRWS